MKCVDYEAVMKKIYAEVKPILKKGELPQYIPELAKGGAEAHFGMSLKLVNGEEYTVGESTTKFSMQSISKVMALTLAIQKKGERVWKRLDKEPSGASFNSLSQLEKNQGFPNNPFLNSGALVIADVLLDCLRQPKASYINLLKEVSGDRDIRYDKKVAISELKHGHRNRALVNYLKEFGSITNDVNKVLELYINFCSVEMTCLDLARAFSYLANEGQCLVTGKRILSPSQTKRTNALLMTCGTYNGVGNFAYRVGLPGKSGVGGGIIVIYPRKFILSVWSPRLDQSGNSLAGIKALELFTSKTGLSVF